ncbi:MAG: SusC/RagA family TonB-linked outer membrane protein [Flavisolibacter sp.]|jgi:ferric enterobactin receptor|nr:SusC/RagA family TonB-linked outer membrane protein [Flavisolibacter sp.]
MKKTGLLTMVFLLVAQFAMAQQRNILGKVTDENSGDGLAGISIRIKSTNRGTATKDDGTFTISAKKGEVLQFSSITHESQEHRIGDADVLTIRLRSKKLELEEVVVTGYGIKRQKRELGYSTQEIKGEDIEQAKRENFINALAGRVAGATISSTSGAPGASAQIILRGAISLNGRNQPLMVVDGLVIDNSTFNQDNLVASTNVNSGVNFLNRGNDYSNRGIDINPDDIESVTILKGPEAMTLYGSEGSSGAIVITTRQAKKGKASVAYDVSYRAEKITRFPEIQTEYSPGRNGQFDPTLRFYGGPRYGDSLEKFDNIHNFFEPGQTMRHNLSLEGGTEQAGYRFSMSYTDQKGVIPTTRFKRLTSRVGGNVRVSSKINLNGSITYSSSENVKASKGTGGYLLSLLTWPVVDDIRDYLSVDGTRRKIFPTSTTEVDNPFFDVYKNKSSDHNDRMTGNVNIGYDATSWLNLNAIAGVDFYTTTGNFFRHPESRYGFATNGFISDYTNNFISYNAVAKITVRKKVGNFANTLILGASHDDVSTKTYSQRGERLSVPDFNNLRNADPTSISALNTTSQYRKQGIFANYILGFKSLLYASLTWRNDWDSRIIRPDIPGRPVDFKLPSFDFKGGSISYVFTDHEFLKSQRIVNFGKLRISYSDAGKPPFRNYILGPSFGSNVYTNGGFVLNSTLGNPAIKPERTENLEIGTELRFLNSRLSVDFAWYKVKSTDQLMDVRTSYGTGSVITWLNGGEVVNRGFEVQVKANAVKTKDINWNITLNADRNVGKIISLPANVPEYSNFQTFGAGDVRPITTPGAFTSSLSARKYQRNKNGDILIDAGTGLPLRESIYSIVGDRSPDYKLGFVNDIKFKQFSLTVNTDFSSGGDIYNGNASYLFANMLTPNTLDRETPRVIKGVLKDGFENTNTPTQNMTAITPYFSNNYYDFTGSTGASGFSEEDFIEKNIKTFRVRDITLSYRIPATALKKASFIRNARLYVTITDPILISNYTGPDPNTNYLTPTFGGYGGVGIDFGSLANPIGYNIGISLNF